MKLGSHILCLTHWFTTTDIGEIYLFLQQSYLSNETTNECQ